MQFAYLTDLINKLSKRDDTEHEQVVIRLAIATSIGLYLGFIDAVSWRGGIAPIFVISCFVCYSFACMMILAAVIKSPDRNPGRIILGICLDCSAATFLMIYGGAATAAVYGVYLWITIGNGLRFGRSFLLTSVVISVLGFSTVIAISPYWQENYAIGLGLVVWLFLLPLYIYRLLTKLEHANELASSANRARRDFLANMSHEIRTPLTAIIGFAEASLDSEQSMQERMSALKTIVRNGTHLHNVVNDILDFSKIEANKLVVENIKTNLIDVTQDVDAIIRPKAQEKNIIFKTEYVLPLPLYIYTDSLKFKQILINLCNNAIKFTHEGFVLVQVRYDGAQNLLNTSVIDTGIGLTQKQIANCLNPFEQAELSTSRKYGGTGLGLPLSQKFISLLGGKLNISSTPNKGSCFEASIDAGQIDLATLVHDPEELQADTQNVEFDNTPNLKLKGDVLIVDDNETNQELFSLFLRRMGVRVTTVDCGIEALKLTVNHSYDLIYLDMNMPQLSGLDTVAKLREIGYQQPIVALTANATSEYKTQCLQGGYDDFLTKPVLRKHFQEMTAKYLCAATDADIVPEPIFSTLLQQEPEFSDLVEKFVVELHETELTIDLLVASENWQELKQILHNLKGTAGGLGYPILTNIAGKIEFQLVSENFDAVEDLLSELKRILNRIFDGMQLTQNLNQYTDRLG